MGGRPAQLPGPSLAYPWDGGQGALFTLKPGSSVMKQEMKSQAS